MTKAEREQRYKELSRKSKHGGQLTIDEQREFKELGQEFGIVLDERKIMRQRDDK
jgi:hypothetical protein